MKFNKKLVVTALSTALGLGIVGSISGTIAWYQYSTRSTAAFVGTSVRSTANLLVSVNGEDFYSSLTSSQINAKLADLACKNSNLAPITTGAANQKNGALPSKFYSNPTYQDFTYDKWGVANAKDYVQFTLTLKYTGVDGGDTDAPLSGKNIYLNDLLIKADSANTKEDISDAVRVHLGASGSNMYLSNAGQSTVLGGNLDLGGPAGADNNIKWAEFETDNTPVPYGDATLSQLTYKLGDVKPTMTNNVLSGGQSLGVTDSNGKLEVTVTIWLEGWQKLYSQKSVNEGDSVTGLYEKNDQGNYVEITDSAAVAESGKKYYSASSADWSVDSFVNAKFDLGLEFITERVN